MPRSSTYKNFGIIQANSCGIIDNSYCGDNDMWKMPVIAVREPSLWTGLTGADLEVQAGTDKLKFICHSSSALPAQFYLWHF